MRTDFNFAWPTAEIAVMGPEGAVNILYKRELEAAPDPAVARAEKVAEFRDKFANPFVAAARGYLDEIIRPRETRRKLIAALRNLENKRDRNPPKKHGKYLSNESRRMAGCSVPGHPPRESVLQVLGAVLGCFGARVLGAGCLGEEGQSSGRRCGWPCRLDAAPSFSTEPRTPSTAGTGHPST